MLQDCALTEFYSRIIVTFSFEICRGHAFVPRHLPALGVVASPATRGARPTEGPSE